MRHTSQHHLLNMTFTRASPEHKIQQNKSSEFLNWCDSIEVLLNVNFSGLPIYIICFILIYILILVCDLDEEQIFQGNLWVFHFELSEETNTCQRHLMSSLKFYGSSEERKDQKRWKWTNAVLFSMPTMNVFNTKNSNHTVLNNRSKQINRTVFSKICTNFLQSFLT